MSAASKAERRVRATEEAAAWAVRLDGKSLSAAEHLEFVDWLRESPVHVAEMLRVSEVHVSLSEYPWWSQMPASGDFASAEVIPLPSTVGHQALAQKPWRSRLKRSMIGLGIAAALAGVVALLIRPQVDSTVVRTLPGERRELTLADGSTLRAAPNTDLRIEMSRDYRSIIFHHGKAEFDVAKDPLRPFSVETTQARVLALGTVFSVEDDATHAVVVTVTEGKVAVTRTQEVGLPGGRGSNLGTLALAAHQRVEIASTGEVRPIQLIDDGADQRQSIQQIAFEKETVASVVRRFNAVNRVQIKIVDPALGELPVSGVFGASDPRSFVGFLEAAAGARSVQSGEYEIMIGSRQHPAMTH